MTTDVDGSLSPVRNPCFTERDDDYNDNDSVHGGAYHPSVFNDMVSSSSNNNLQQASGWTSSSENEGDAMDEDSEGGTSKFKEQRRAHYDEFHKVRELRRKESLNGECGSDAASSLAVGVEDIDITDDKQPKHALYHAN
ncbi:hypothetical protein L2E82_31659 [Cichorium intybus]|uniref:Uncharacterized protein n=1 Tax=Cichorium intybus TaxID=13427 RepID=A0ACB9BFD9_CICIN|nr:hypothetical protein L2E82_31659 [Cichorium intybus]